MPTTSASVRARTDWGRNRLAARRWLARYRRLVAAALLAAAVVDVAGALRPGSTPGTPVVIAARDLVAGSVLTAADVRLVPEPRSAVADGSLTTVGQAVGATVGSSVRRGEVLTDVRVSAGLRDRLAPGEVAAPVRLADGGLAAVLAPGARVDLVASSSNGASRTIASDVRVVSVATTGGSLDPMSGVLVVFAVPDAVAATVVGAAQHGAVSVVLH